jgi:hypothetical protein
MACRPVAGQRPCDKQICNKISLFRRQQLDTATEKWYFLCDQCRDVVSRRVSEVKSVELNGVSEESGLVSE